MIFNYMPAKVIAFSNQKGGTGKTTTVLNLAGVLADKGKKTLVIDLDPQGSLTTGFGVDIFDLGKNIYNVVIGQEPLDKVVMSLSPNLDIAPTDINLSAAELELYMKPRREDRLKNALEPMREAYEYILIDCPPSLGMLTINALSAADGVVIPMACDFYSLVGVRLLLQSITSTKAELNPALDIVGILPTRFDQRTNHSKEVLQELRDKLSNHVTIFETVIHETVKLKEASSNQKTITDFSPEHRAADDYRNFAEEFLVHA